MNAKMKMDRAATMLLRSYPFWGSLYLGFVVEETTRVPYTGTDGVKLWYNPDYVMDQDEEVLCTDLAHACQHKAMLHNFRRGQRDSDMWHNACDYAVNALLKGAGFTLGENHLYDPQYDGMSEEEIYDYLNQHPEEQPDNEDEGQTSDELMDHPSVGGKGTPDDSDDGDGEDQDGEGDSDSDGDGEDQDGEGQGSDKSDGQGSGDPQPISAPAIGQSEADVLVEVSQARTLAEEAGMMPGNMERVVEEILNPKIRPEEILQEFMEQCAADDFSWQVPDRRFLDRDMYLPGMESEGLREFVIAVDVSMSVNHRMYAYFTSVISKIAEVLPFETLHILYCDTEVRRAESYSKADLPIDYKTTGGGGTRFSPVFEYLEREAIQPSGLAYLTDLKCSDYPTLPPAYKVLWLVDGAKNDAPFGDILNIEEFK